MAPIAADCVKLTAIANNRLAALSVQNVLKNTKCYTIQVILKSLVSLLLFCIQNVVNLLKKIPQNINKIMDSNNDLSEELMRRLSSGGGLGECRNWIRCGQRSRRPKHLWNANVPKKKHMHSVSRKF